jgi:5-methylcytosine-specific restriction protein A
MTRIYDTANWKKIAALQLARQPLCQSCDGVVAASLVDHIIPITKGGAERDPANLQSLCRECHAQKTSCEKFGRKWIAMKYRGCNLDGSPRSAPSGGN